MKFILKTQKANKTLDTKQSNQDYENQKKLIYVTFSYSGHQYKVNSKM